MNTTISVMMQIKKITKKLKILIMSTSGGTDKRLAASNRLTKLGYLVENNVKFPAPRS